MKNKKIMGILIILSFLISILTPFIDLSGLGTRNVNATPKTSTDCLFNGRTYTFNLDDFYDDEDLTKIWTEAKFQTEMFNGTSLEWTGVVNNDTVTPVNNTETQYGKSSGVYNGTYDFRDDTVGQNPAGWTITETGGTVNVIAEKDGHNKVLEFYDDDPVNGISASNSFTIQTDGTIEFWWAYNGTEAYLNYLMTRYYESSSERIRIIFDYTGVGQIMSHNGSEYISMITGLSVNTFYHISIICDDSANTFDFYVDGVNKGTFDYFVNSVVGISKISMNTRSNGYDYWHWIDAVGYSGDPDYTIGENLYPDNIIMMNGSYDYTDNMKVNDDSSTNFTSTHTDGYIYETPSQWDNFTFTNGTGDTIGELETIDANYSTLISTECIPPLNEFITSVDYTEGEYASGSLPNTWIDDGNYYRGYDEYTPYSIDVEFLFDNELSGRDFLISADIYSTPTSGIKAELLINDVMWKEGELIDFDDELAENVNKISFQVSEVSIPYMRIYYFKIVEVNGGTPAELDVQVDIQITDPDLSSIEFFKYSHKTNVSVTMDLDIWNWDTSTWYEIESIDNSATFDDDSFTLGIDSDYVNSSFGVRIRFQASSSSSDFALLIDRFRLDYLTTPAELEMTITFLFAKYNEDLLAMTIQSWQKTNISQLINFSIWNFDTELYVQISSSSDTTFTKKEYNTESPSNFISPSGVVKLYWVGSDITNDFELHIDYLFIQIFYKLDLVHEKSFDTNGIWRYRWAVLGSIHYTQWVNFEVIDPISNFHAISESDATTRWILQGSDISAVENFTDDISGANWNLYGVSEDSFTAYSDESYLFNNITFVSYDYIGTHFDVGTEDTSPKGITWDGTFYWVLGSLNDEVYQYTSAGVYTGTHFDVGGQDTSPTSITWDGTFFYVVGDANNRVYQYTDAGVYTTVNFNVGGEDTSPWGIVWDGTHFWVVGAVSKEIYQYTDAGVYTTVHFDVGTQDNLPTGIAWDETYFWVSGDDNNRIYQYTSAGVYTGVNMVAQDSWGDDISWDGSNLQLVGNTNNRIYQYEELLEVFKKYQGGGLMYMQTNITELLSLKSTDYGIHYTLSSGDYFEVDFQTNSDSQINVILLKDGVVNKTLVLSQSGNTNFNRHTVQISVDELVEFDQLKVSSTFEDTDNVKVYDIKTKKYTLTGDYADFRVGSHQDYSIYLNPDTYNLRISEEGDVKVNINITISSAYNYYIYEPIQTQYCRIALFSVEGNYLNFQDYHVKVNRSLNGEYNQFWLLDTIFYADDETYVYIDVYDRFDSLIDTFERLASDYIDLELEVYQLQIKNLMEQKTTVDINATHVYPLLSGESLYFMLSKQYYQIGYYDEYNVYKNFTIYLNSNKAYQLNSSLKTIYFSMFTYDGLGIEHELVRFYINNKRKDFGFYSTLEDSLNLVILDFFNNTLANETIDANAYDNSEYNLFIEIYSLIILNQFTYEDIIVNISQVGSGVWMTQIIPKQFGFMYRFLPNINYTINVYFTNETLYSSRVINLTDNSHIESFGVPTQPTEYPKDVYFGIYTTTGLGVNHDLLRFYINGNRTDFGFNLITDMIINITVMDFFNTTLFTNPTFNTSGIYEYNILITLYSLKIKNEARETSNYTLKLGGLETTGLILPNEIIEYQLATNNYVFDYTNNEDDSFHTININLNENKVYIINSTYYTAYFGLFDQYDHRLDNSLFSLYLNGTRKDFGFIELSSEYYNITVYDWLNIPVFDQIIYLFNYTEYNIYITVFELQIRHLAQENSNFSLYETTTGNYINFSMAPDTISSYMLSSSTYNVSWTNGENLQTSYYFITLDSNYILTLSSIYHSVYFALFTYDGIGINYDLVKFYINESRKDFGFNLLTSALAEIVVLDFFNNTLFNQTIDFSSLSEYNIFVEIYSLIILNQFTYEDIITNITQVDSGIWLNHIIPKQFALSCRFAPNMNYTINVYYVNNSLYATRTINLTENNHIESFGTPTLPSEYPKDIYFSVYTGTGLAIQQQLVKLYLDGDRADFGFNTIESVMVSVVVKDFFNTTLFNQNINTSGIYEYDILIDIYSLKIKNEALRIVNYTLKLGSLTDTGNILPDEIIEYQLSTNSYIFEYTNQEDNSFGSISFTLDEDKVYILNSTYYDIYFSLYDVNLHTFYSTQYEFRLNNTIQDLGLIEDLLSDNYNITVKDRFGTYLFNNIINLRGLNEYRIEISLFELQIRHLAEENSNLTLIETILNNTYSFIMTPDSIKSILMGSSNYTLNWTNGENNQLTMFSINLTSDAVIKLNTTYFDVYFSLFTYDGFGVNHDFVRFYINGLRKDFGFNTLKQDSNTLTVLDYFNATLFNSNINLKQFTEYNIYVEIYTMIIFNNYSHPIKIKIERNDIEFEQVIEAQFGMPYRMLPKVEYLISTYYLNGTLIEEREVELDKNNKIVSFGFFETEVPVMPEPLEWDIWTFVAFIVIFSVIGWIIVFAWSYMKKEKDRVPKKTRRMYKNKGWRDGTFEKQGV